MTPTQTALRETVKNITPTDLTDYRVLAGVRLPEFREHLLDLMKALAPEQLREAVNQEALPELWPRSLQCYADSGSFRDSGSNFKDFILPFSGKLKSDQIDGLLAAVMRNRQNWDAGGTSGFLESLLKNTSSTDFPSAQSRDEFFHSLARWRDERYEEVIKRLRADGWTPPESWADDEE